jgi:hypothetical protein
MAGDLLGISMTHIEELIGSGKNQTTMDTVSIALPRLTLPLTRRSPCDWCRS